MGKIFIFGIGGTGSRVIKALTMLLASGVKINASEVVPIIIDPDRSNGDLSRTVEILKQYKRIRERIGFEDNNFFQTKISTLDELVPDTENKRAENDFRFTLNDVQDEKFKDFIDLSSQDDVNKYLTQLLFSQENLDSSMEVGFKGNPNIGSVVLNQFYDSEEFAKFASNFNDDDRIFIISSIFGGTGAAGFPLLLKNIRNASDNLPNHSFLRNAKIGAISLLPYFGISPDENSKIDKATFMSKTKAALYYYNRNIGGNKSINTLYYIGDNQTKDYENHEGSTKQKNDAHFVELAAALSIIDFMDLEDHSLSQNGVVSPIYKEFGINKDTNEINLKALGEKTYQTIAKSLSQYWLFQLYLNNRLEISINKQPWSNRGSTKIDKGFLTNPFYDEAVKRFNKNFRDWIEEMAKNKAGFTPFNLELKNSNHSAFIKEIEGQGGLSMLKNFTLFDHHLNKAERKVKVKSKEQKFISLFYNATESILNSKYNL